MSLFSLQNHQEEGLADLPPFLLADPLSVEALSSQIKTIFQKQITALQQVQRLVGQAHLQALQLLAACQGRLLLMGLGKSGLIAQKIAATFSSLGMPAFFVHAAEAAHGDLGCICPNDVVLALSYSGVSHEWLTILPALQALEVPLIAITKRHDSSLGQAATVVLPLGDLQESCPWNTVPTSSTTAMLVLGDALAMSWWHQKGANREDFARNHPGGMWGKRLLPVSAVMRCGVYNPLSSPEASLLDVIDTMGRTPGRPGACSIVDKAGCLIGFFTDGDVRRLLLQGLVCQERVIADCMHRHPKTLLPHVLVEQAIACFQAEQIDQFPIVDAQGHLLGLLDIHDVLR